MPRFAGIMVAMAICLTTEMARAEVWKSIDVVTYPVGIGADGKPRNRIVSIEATGPPRSAAAAQKTLMTYAQESVNMALASAVSAFYATPGEVSAKASAAFGAFKSTIAYRASRSVAFRAMANFDAHTAQREVKSDSLKVEYHDPARILTAQGAEILKKAFPAVRKQIAQLHGAYAYLQSLQHPDMAFSVNTKEIADRLKVSPDRVRQAQADADKFAKDGGRSLNDAFNHAAAQVSKSGQRVASEAEQEKNKIVKGIAHPRPPSPPPQPTPQNTPATIIKRSLDPGGVILH
jgi:hypothetical protein